MGVEIMRRKSIFMFILSFILLVAISFLAMGEEIEKQASDFQSNGDCIAGWYWLRDHSLQHTAEWTFQDIPSGDKLTLEITALATDQASGGKGFDAHFLLIYGFPGSGQMGGLFKSKKVILPNITPKDDPVGYTCCGKVTLDRSFMAEAQEILVKVERESSQDNHIAFKKESIKLLTISGIEEKYQEDVTDSEIIPKRDQLPETDTSENARQIGEGQYTGELGKKTSGQIDHDDYYSIDLKQGQLITL